MGKKTINQALKDLFLGLGGDSSALADNSSVSDYIEDLESAIKGAASGELPEVTAEDIGDVLAVVSDGEGGANWGKGEIPSELPSVEAADIGDVLTVVSDGESGAEWAKGSIIVPQEIAVFLLGVRPTGANHAITIENSKTWGDIKAEIDAGKLVILKDNANGVYIYNGIGYAGTSASQNNYFVSITKDTGDNNYVICEIHAANNLSSSATSLDFYKTTMPILPMVNNNDNDKILKVVGGVWTAVTP